METENPGLASRDSSLEQEKEEEEREEEKGEGARDMKVS